MRKILALACLLSAAPVLASDLPEIPGGHQKCLQALEPLLAKHQSKNDWVRQADPAPGARLYRSPSAKIGQWLELEAHEGETPRIRFYTPKAATEYRLDSSCGVSQAPYPLPKYFFSVPNRAEFTDADLEKLVASGKKTLIYVWSPRMVYSVYFLDRYRQVAKRKGFRFIAVMDPFADRETAVLAADRIHVPLRQARALASSEGYWDATIRLASLELMFRNAMIHYPTSFIVANGKLDSFRILGVKTDMYIEKNLDEHGGAR